LNWSNRVGTSVGYTHPFVDVVAVPLPQVVAPPDEVLL